MYELYAKCGLFNFLFFFIRQVAARKMIHLWETSRRTATARRPAGGRRNILLVVPTPDYRLHQKNESFPLVKCIKRYDCVESVELSFINKF